MKDKKIKKDKKAKKVKRPLRTRFDLINRFRHWYLGGVAVKHSVFRVKGALQTLLVLLVIISIGYAMAAFYTKSGEFVISIDRGMAEDGFVLSETTDFSEQLITLNGDVVVGATNISIYDIQRDVMNVDGKHNGINYLAYTFYIKNETGQVKDYQYQLHLKRATKGTEYASWIMLYHNNVQNIYAMPNKDGNPERIFSGSPFPFMKYAGELIKETKLTKDNPGYMTQDKMDYFGVESAEGMYQLEAVPFMSSDVVCAGTRKGIKDEEYDKFTVVIWMEGEDPECVDDIIGGNLEFSMSFSY